MKILYILGLSLIMCASCGETGPKTAVAQEPSEKLVFPHNIEKLKFRPHLEEIRSVMKNLINLRAKGMKEDMRTLTYYHIQAQYVSNLNKIDASIKYDGQWLKFDDDYTFKYGIYDRVIGSGIFHYSESTERLMMLDDDPQIEPKMWTIKSNSDYINMMGLPLLLVEDLQKKRNLIMDNFTNDKAINRMGKKVITAHNGMQMKMLLLVGQPTR